MISLSWIYVIIDLHLWYQELVISYPNDIIDNNIWNLQWYEMSHDSDQFIHDFAAGEWPSNKVLDVARRSTRRGKLFRSFEPPTGGIDIGALIGIWKHIFDDPDAQSCYYLTSTFIFPFSRLTHFSWKPGHWQVGIVAISVATWRDLRLWPCPRYWNHYLLLTSCWHLQGISFHLQCPRCYIRMWTVQVTRLQSCSLCCSQGIWSMHCPSHRQSIQTRRGTLLNCSHSFISFTFLHYTSQALLWKYLNFRCKRPAPRTSDITILNWILSPN